MRVRNFCLGALVVSLFGLGTVHGQGSQPGYGQGSQQVPYGLGGPMLTPETALGEAGPSELRAPVGLSRWIVGPERPACCGPTGGNEIQSEIYARSGLTRPFGNGPVAQSLDSGWAIQGGLRVLFFDGCGRSAWTVDASLSNMFNNGSNAPVPFGYIVPLTDAQAATFTTVPTGTTTGGTTTTPGTTGVASTGTFVPAGTGSGGAFLANASLRSLNRTYVNLAVGREYYVMGEALRNTGEMRWRVGADVGGRYGTEKMHFNQPFLTHATDLSWGAFASVHSDIEIPFGGFDLYFGTRVEYNYTWSEIAGGNNDGDVQDALFLATVGVRF